jgi:hypothetical protein
MGRGRQKGSPKTPGSGRKKGSVNKVTASVKEAVLAAFDEVGGVRYLVAVARTEPRVFIALLARCLPQVLQGEELRPLTVRIMRFERQEPPGAGC